MKAYRVVIFSVLVALVLTAPSVFAAPKKRLLVFTLSSGFRHSTATPSAEYIKAMAGKSKDFEVVATEDPSQITPENLKKFDGLYFYTTGNLPISEENRRAMLEWIKSGKGFIGVHAATDTWHGWMPYIEMIGGEFQTHGPQVNVKINVYDPKHPAGKPVPQGWSFTEEIYEHKNLDMSKIHLILALDSHPQTKQPMLFPIAWCKQYGKGRVFYTALGHREDMWENPIFQAHLLGGIRWALGLVKGDAKPNVKMPPPPPQPAQTG